MEMTVDDRSGAAPSRAAGGRPRLSDGTTLNERYQIEALMGRSVYGESYRARDVADGRLVTITTLNAALVADGEVRARLDREIQIAINLDHKNIAVTYGLFGATVGNDPVAYLASEHVDGQSLREMIDTKRAGGKGFSLKGAYNVVAHLCNALAYAHGATWHGGINPDTVMVSAAGRVKLIDFGLARTLRAIDHFSAQAAGGGLGFLAPEMATAPDTADARADLYSVGAILFELLTGRAPSDTFEPPSIMQPGVPPTVDPVIEKALRPLPQERYPDAQSLKDALHTSLAAELAAAGAAAEPHVAQVAPGAPKPPPPKPKTAAPPAPPPVKTAAPPPPTKPAAPPAPAAASQSPPRAKLNTSGAMTALDDQTERWLISNGKMDFGPFSMREVRHQIEIGKIQGDDFITDTHSDHGERRRVREHPQLRDLVMKAQAELAEKARVDREHHDRRKHRGRIVTILGIIALVVFGGGGGIAYYVLYVMKPKEVVKVVHDQIDLKFLEGVQFAIKVEEKPKTKKIRRPKPGGKPGEFEDATVLGDASQDGGDETLSQAQINGVMAEKWKVLVGCMAEERQRNSGFKSLDMDFIIKGSGQVSAVKANGQTGTPLAGCLYGKMQSVAFPKFNGNKTQASFSMNFK